MSDRLTLKDLQVVPMLDVPGGQVPVHGAARPATLDDWIEVGESEGGEVVEAENEWGTGDYLPVWKPGRYLVKRLSE